MDETHAAGRGGGLVRAELTLPAPNIRRSSSLALGARLFDLSLESVLRPSLDGLHALCDARLKAHHRVVAAGHADDRMCDDRELRFREPPAYTIHEHRSGHSALLEHRPSALHETGVGVGANLPAPRHVRDGAAARS